jgi:4-aminobutyrate aminotransferase
MRERDARVIADIGKLRFSPACLVGGRGSRLIEEGGRELLDLSASFGPAVLGYGHENGLVSDADVAPFQMW